MKHILKISVMAAIIFCSGCGRCTRANQDQDPILQGINTALSQGKCEKAQKLYNAYKAGGNTDKDIEARIKNCVEGFAETKQQPDVYVAGTQRNAQGIYVATLWKNGVEQNLTDGTYDTGAGGIFISDNDVYVTGLETKEKKGVPKLWKNGVEQNLSMLKEGYSSCGISSAFVSNDDVYVAGCTFIEKNKHVALLWKNGIVQQLNYGVNSSSADAVFVSNGDVYVAGVVGKVATLWKNGIAHNLTDEKTFWQVLVRDIYVVGNDVYVVGCTRLKFAGNSVGNSVATLWKNGVAQYLSDGNNDAEANSVFVLGNDVYVVGQDGWVATLWKNGVAQNFTDGEHDASISSVFVLDNEVYMIWNEVHVTQDEKSAHWDYDRVITTFWKNGEVEKFTDRRYSSVFVKYP